MKYIVILFASFAIFPFANAALAPQYQNAKDLDVMVGYVKAHPLVLRSLRSLDAQKFIVHFGEDCRVLFARAITSRPTGWAGPQDPLEFRSSTCPVD